MRAHHVIAVVAVLIVGLGAKQLLLPPRHADANISTVSSASLDVLQMQRDIDIRKLAVESTRDATFVFDNE